MAWKRCLIALFLWAGWNSCRACSANNYTCQADSPCCSKFGYCGNTDDHCSVANCVAGCNTTEASNVIIEFSSLHQLGPQSGIYTGCVDPAMAALSFDDGIHPKITARLLKILRKQDVKSTFFVLGQTISRYLDLDEKKRNRDFSKNRAILKKMVAAGHEIGSHTFDHPSLPEIPTNNLLRQMEKTSSLVLEHAGTRMSLMRPPYG